MADVGVKELLQAGVHFGHQTRRWHPKMRRYIFGERDGIYIIDLLKTEVLLERARAFVQDLASKGGMVLFVGTKKQAKDTIRDVAEDAGMLYVHERWLGGLLTNFNTIRKRINRLHDLTRLSEEGQLALLPTKERMSMEAELEKLDHEPLRRAQHGAAARRGVRDRPERGGDRRARRPRACTSPRSGWSTPTATPSRSTS